MRLLSHIKIKPGSSKKILTFSVFLFIATIFWFLNALDKEYISSVKVPLVYHNLPNGKKIAYSKTHALEVKLKGYGFDIVGKLPKEMPPLSVNLEKSAVRISQDNDKYYIRTAQLKSLVKPSNSNSFTVVSIKPDTIFLDLESVAFKKVPVKLNSKLNFAESYMLSGKISIKPDSVYIQGRQDSVNSIHEVYTKKIEKEIKGISTITADLQTIRGIDFKQHKVNVFIPAEQFSEKTITLDIQSKNVPDSLHLIIFPKKIKLKLNIPLSIYKIVSASNFTATVDYQNITDIKQTKLKPVIQYKPVSDFEFSEDNMRIIPESVDFIIEKNL